ncbi:flagellar hook protein FlgE [Butyrivibrio sp. VCB2006]|uniref:flagellar hook protein FlgE n=1 Tax=Butyrivibrio sp. VCB2006 TaxID=1280679 RepID=UPI00040120B9|nr:flagellar hook-basal body complex protein [Butyrivibrio sp. VCB2006]
MMRSLWSAVSGLQTHQLEMDVIGNNIANVNTTSYKSQATGFQDVLYQTIKTGAAGTATKGSVNADQIGLGAKMGSININITKAGSAQTTYNPLDLMITGDSFFIISPDSTTLNYSRDGGFTIDAEGDLVTQNNGYYVMGTMGDGDITEGAAVTKLRVMDRQTERQGYDAQGNPYTYMVDTMPGSATTASYMKGNIDSDDPTLKEGKIVMIEAYGTDGEAYTIKFKIDDAGDDDIGTFNLSVDAILDKQGNRQPVNKQTFLLNYDKHDGKLLTNQMINLNAGGNLATISLDMSNTSNYASSMGNHQSTIYAYKGDTKGLNKGYPEGELTGISVTDNGSIYGKYSNGETIKKGQIAVAMFNNAMGLEKVGDNLYAESLNSGAAMIQDITQNGGYMQSGVLEASNVDLAKEFTDMITTQRGFQANSRVITTSDELLQVLKGLKR